MQQQLEIFELVCYLPSESNDVPDHHPQCIVCERQVWRGSSYYNSSAARRSSPVSVSAHIGCALSACKSFKIRLNQKKQITHPTHQKHPLYLHDRVDHDDVDDDDDDDDEYCYCKRCKQDISNYRPTYGCKACNHYIDKWCLDLPRTITHPFHSCHSLLLQDDGWGYCNACECRIEREGLMYACTDCNEFRTHTRCALSFENFNLPGTICHPKCHFHPLALKSRHVEAKEDDLGEDQDQNCYCDACEEPRDPNDCLYYCHLCNFQVHVKCVSSELQLLVEQEQVQDYELIRVRDILDEEEKAKRLQEANDRSAEEAKLENFHTLNEVLCSYITNREVNDAEINKICKALTWDNIFGSCSKFDDAKRLLYSDDHMIIFISKLNSKSTFTETKRVVLETLSNQYGEERVVMLEISTK